jgi:hypothetical protein
LYSLPATLAFGVFPRERLRLQSTWPLLFHESLTSLSYRLEAGHGLFFSVPFVFSTAQKQMSPGAIAEALRNDIFPAPLPLSLSS